MTTTTGSNWHWWRFTDSSTQRTLTLWGCCRTSQSFRNNHLIYTPNPSSLRVYSLFLKDTNGNALRSWPVTLGFCILVSRRRHTVKLLLLQTLFGARRSERELAQCQDVCRRTKTTWNVTRMLGRQRARRTVIIIIVILMLCLIRIEREEYIVGELNKNSHLPC